MKEFIEKLIGRLEEREAELKTITAECKPTKEIKDKNYGYYTAMNHAKEIVNQLAEEYSATDNDQDLMIIESLPSLYPMMQSFEVEAINRVVERAEYNNGWISCNERLPEKSGKYIVTQKRYSLDDRFRKRPISTETDYVEFNKLDNSWCRAKFLDVIAWQPLPAPYQPKE